MAEAAHPEKVLEHAKKLGHTSDVPGFVFFKRQYHLVKEALASDKLQPRPAVPPVSSPPLLKTELIPQATAPGSGRVRPSWPALSAGPVGLPHQEDAPDHQPQPADEGLRSHEGAAIPAQRQAAFYANVDFDDLTKALSSDMPFD